MHERIEKVYENKNKLRREVYRFVLLNDFKIYLDEYQTQERETTRHKYQTVDYYSRLMRRDSSLSFDSITVSDRTIKEVKEEILERLTYQPNQ